MRVLGLVTGLVVALAFAAVSLAGPKTTLPSKYIQMTVIINDKAIVLGAQQATKHHGDFTPLGGAVPRGDYLSINIFNRSTKVQSFSFLGKKTPPIKPGGKSHLFTVANARGQFTYKASGSKALHGSVTVA